MRPSVVSQQISTVDVGAWIREAPVWRASGVLADWISQCAA